MRFVSAQVPPKLVRDALKLRLIVGEAGRIRRPIADYDRALFDQILQLPQHRQRHALAAAAEIENAITRSARSDEPSVLEAQLVQQHVAVRKVEGVAIRRIRNRLPAEDLGQRPLFAIEVRDIGGVMSLLEHPGTAREVRNPGLGFLGPGVVAIEPQAERPEGEAGRHIGH